MISFYLPLAPPHHSGSFCATAAAIFVSFVCYVTLPLLAGSVFHELRVVRKRLTCRRWIWVDLHSPLPRNPHRNVTIVYSNWLDCQYVRRQEVRGGIRNSDVSWEL